MGLLLFSGAKEHTCTKRQAPHAHAEEKRQIVEEVFRGEEYVAVAVTK